MSYYSQFWGKGRADAVPLAQELSASGGDGPYGLAEAMLKHFALAPDAESQLATLSHIAQTAELEDLRDMAVLMLLNPDEEARRGTPEILEAHFDRGLVTPAGLWRMIVMRNWLPEEERPPLDHLIKCSRVARIECASVAKRQPVKLRASAIDRTLGQALWFMVGGDEGWSLGHLMVDGRFGVREVSVVPWGSYSETLAEIREMNREIHSFDMNVDYLGLVVRHFLAVSAQSGDAPPLGLLQMAEALGVGDWSASSVDPATAIAELVGEINPRQFTDRAMGKTLAESAEWATRDGLTAMWSLQEESVVELLRQRLGPPHSWIDQAEAVPALLLEEHFEPRREDWIERFLWAALFLKHMAKPKPVWKKFLIVAWALHERNEPLASVSVLRELAHATLLSSLSHAVIHGEIPQERIAELMTEDLFQDMDD